MRGIQVSESIKDSNFFDHSEVGSNLDKIHKNVIVVRNRPSKNIEKLLRDRGHILGYDIIDSASGEFYFRKNPVNYANHVDDNFYSFYIVNNTHIKRLVEKVSNKKIYVIPHHHVNLENHRSYFGEKPISSAGYLGLPEQLTDQEEIASIFQKYNIDFKVFNPKTREECVDFLKDIQVGITYMKNEYHDVFSKAKPNSKIVNYQSFGIVTLCDNFESYLEFGNNGFMTHKSLIDFEENIKNLVESKDARRNISDISFRNSKDFNIDHIVSKFYIGKILGDF